MKEQIGADNLLTSYQVGELLQVNPSSINKWVKEGRIPAFRTPGGHHRIRASDLVSFLHEHKMLVPRQLTEAGRRRLLIVDDDPKQLNALRRAFKGYKRFIDFRTSDNGVDALVQIGLFHPHVVVLDSVMPGVDSIEICKRLKNYSKELETKVVLASGRFTAKTEKRAKDAGASRCLQKPIDVEAVIEELEVLELGF